MPVPRVAVQQLVETDSELASIGVQAVYGSNSVDSAPEDCFIVLHWETTTKAFGLVGSPQLTVWVYDKERDYSLRIDPAIDRVKTIFTEAVHVPGSDGITLTAATWNGDSDDLFDDGYNAITRTASFSLSGHVS